MYIGYTDGVKKVTKINSFTNPLIGSWGGCTSDLTRVIYTTFVDESHWYFVQAGTTEDVSGIQFGTYSWNSTTNAFSKQFTYKVQSEWGGFDINTDKYIISKDTLFSYFNNLPTEYGHKSYRIK